MYLASLHACESFNSPHFASLSRHASDLLLVLLLARARQPRAGAQVEHRAAVREPGGGASSHVLALELRVALVDGAVHVAEDGLDGRRGAGSELGT